MLLTRSQRETIGTCVPLLFHPSDETKLPVARVVVYDTILLLNISLELRVKEKLLRYPEEVFFDSQGIPAKLLSSYPIILVLV